MLGQEQSRSSASTKNFLVGHYKYLHCDGSANPLFLRLLLELSVGHVQKQEGKGRWTGEDGNRKKSIQNEIDWKTVWVSEPLPLSNEKEDKRVQSVF